MSLNHRYADFGTRAEPSAASDVLNPDGLEDLRLEAFENGYQAGWEDATKAHQEDSARALDALSQSLQDMSFTYHEAYGKIALAIKPLLLQFVAKLMPRVAEKSLHAHVLHEVTSLFDAQVDGAIELAVAPSNLDPLKDLLTQSLTVPFAIIADPNLSHGQVFLRVGAAEREINLDAVVEASDEAVAAFLEQAHMESEHG